MSKIREDLRIGLLGAAAGLFSSSVLLLVDRIDLYYSYLELNPAEADQVCYINNLRELSWIPLAIWHMLLSTVASFMVHRYLTKPLKSPFLLWQVVGITTLFGWALSYLLVMSIDCVMQGDFDVLAKSVATSKLAGVAKYVSVVFACNVFYGSLINASSRQYSERFEEI